MNKRNPFKRICSLFLVAAMLSGMVITAVPTRVNAEEHVCDVAALTEVSAVAATEDTAGNIPYWKCSCGKLYTNYFYDSANPNAKPGNVTEGKFKTDPVSVATPPTAAVTSIPENWRNASGTVPMQTELSDVKAEHLWYYPASSFTIVNNEYSTYVGYADRTYFSVVTDGDVTALKFDVADYAGKHPSEDLVAKFGVTDSKAMRFNLHNGNAVSVQLGWSLPSSKSVLTESNLEENPGAYKLYKIEEGFQFPNSNGNLRVAIFGEASDDKFPLSSELATDLYALKNYPVDIYVYMKAEGDVSCADNENLPTYYIAGFYVVTGHAYEEYVTENEASCMMDKTESATCSVCGHKDVKTIENSKLGHTLTAVDAKDPTPAASGNIAYWECDVCGKYFSDAEGTEEITDKSSVVIPPIHIHALTEVPAVAATEDTAGNIIHWTCSCGQLFWDPGNPGQKPTSVTDGKYKTDPVSVITPPINSARALLEPYRPTVAIPDFPEFKDVNEKHFWYYPVSSFTVKNLAGWNAYYETTVKNGFLSVIDDNGVTAVKYDIAKYYTDHSNSTGNYAVTDANPMAFKVYISNIDRAQVGTLEKELLEANAGQYALYKIADSYEYTGSASAEDFYINPFGDSFVCSEELAMDLNAIKGHTADIYVYMKAEGDITCADTNNLPNYYIAGFYMVTDHTNGESTVIREATCQQDRQEKATCTFCGAESIVTIEGSSASAHKFTNYMFNNDASGDYRGSETAKCEYCDATHTRGLDLNLTDMTIAIPDEATAVEQTAAEELVNYVKQITGKTIAIVKESEAAGDVIYIGNTQFAEDNDVTYPVKSENDLGEGWAIKAVGHNLVLTGGETRGTIYAVYHLLEDVLGVRWWNLWEEFVPSMERAIVPVEYADSGVPVFEYRDIYIGNEKAETLFFVRNRLNGFTSNAPKEYGGEEIYGTPGHTHTFGNYFPANEYYSSHPNWFAYSDATGERISGGQLCLSNEELYEAFKEKLLANIAADFAKAEANGTIPPKYYAITPNDTGGFCECDKCDAAVAIYGESGHLLNFVNKLARAVKETEYADKVKLETLGYWHYVNAPTGGVTAEDNVVLRFADNYMDVMHGINHPNNADFKSRMVAWEELVKDGNFFLWDYAIFFSAGGISPSLYKYGENFKTFMEMGVNGYFVENEQWVNSDMWDMQLWLLAKLMEDPTLGDTPEKYEALMDEFIYGYYGAEPGKYIEAYLDLLNERMEANPTHYRFGATIIAAEWLTVEDILAANDYFEKATAAAGNDEVLLRRIKDARSGLDSVIMYNYSGLSLEATRKGLEFTLDQEIVGRRLTSTLMEMMAIRGKDARAQTLLDMYSDYIPSEDDEMPEAPAINADLPEELADVDPAHVWDYHAGTENPDKPGKYLFGPYSVGEVREDDTSLVGKAIVYDIGTVSDPSKYAVTNSNGLTCNLLTGDGQMVPVDTILRSEIKADGKYHLYKIVDNSDPFKTYAAEFDYFYMFNWDLQNVAIAQDLKTWQNHKVDVYISMKVEGDVTCENPDNMPVYSIDRMIMVTNCDSRKFKEGTEATCQIDATKSGTCPICGKYVTVTVLNSKRSHKYTNYVFDNNATSDSAGTQTATCDFGCGTTKTLPFGTVDFYDEIGAAPTAHVYKYYASDFVDRYLPRVADPDSEYGSAILANTGNMNPDTARMYFSITETDTLPMGIYSGMITGGGDAASGTLIEFTKDNVIVDGKYHIYKAEDVKLDTSVVYEYLHMFRSWEFQLHTIPFAKESSFDFYVSMKVEGDISCTDPNNMPKYYIDYIAVVGSCDDYIVQWTYNDDATCTADGTESGTCFVCGQQSVRVVEGTKLDHSFTTKASDIKATDATCKAAATYYVQCDNCDAVSDTKTVSVGGVADHSFNEKASDIKATDASCTAAATYYVQCDNCDAVSVSETVAVGGVSGHSFTDKASDVKAFGGNCTVGAIHYIQCDNCDSISTTRCIIVGEPKGHNVVNGACTECDYEELFITKQPADVTKKLGTNAVFNVSATGEGLTYQWQYRTGSSGTWKNASATGNKTAKLTVPATASRNGYQYRCKVMDANGEVVYSDVATLYAFGITAQPSSAQQSISTKAVFKITASGNGLTYQWQFRTASSGTWKNASATGNKTTQMTVPATASRNGYEYRCKVTDSNGNVVYSNVVTLKVFDITKEAVTVEQKAGTKAVLTAVVKGSNLSYQWQFRASSSGKWAAATATGNKTSQLTVSATSTRDGFQYRCKITDAEGNVTYTKIATLDVIAIATQSKNATTTLSVK